MTDTRRWTTLGRLFMTLWVLFALPNVIFVLQPGLGPAAMGVTFGLVCWGVVWIWFWRDRAIARQPAVPGARR
jgi:O-antigen/teichoic acid export membrane protein